MVDKNNNACCGCTACKYICPVNAIHMEKNKKGFWVPKVNNEKCIFCNKCNNICPINNEKGLKNCKSKEQYIAVAKKKQVYEMASSGGIFPLIAEKFIDNGEWVAGCGYGKNLMPMHKIIQEQEQLDDLCRSKYVQSSMSDVIREIDIKLKEGKKVLFVGTPCQVAGVKKCLNNVNLYLVDIVCHGVPSQELFKKNKEYIEHKEKRKLIRYEFRLKNRKKNHFYATYLFENGAKKIIPYYKDLFFCDFYEMRSLNEICYHCPFACPQRVGDITLGDYEWGKKYHMQFNNYNNISCILVNSEKGIEMFKEISHDIKYEITEWDNIVERNSNLIHPTQQPKDSINYYEYIDNIGYEKYAFKYFHSMRYLKKTCIANFIRKLKIKKGRK